MWRVAARVLGSAFLRMGILLIAVALVSVIFVYCYQYVLTSPFFALEHVRIMGVGDSTKERLVRSCGLRKGQNILSLRLDEVRKKIEADPWIRSARVERELPDTLLISVVREEAWAIVVAEQLYYMNRCGEIFKNVEPHEPTDLPVITGVSDLGSEADEELKRVAVLLSMLKKEKDPISIRNLSEIHLSDPKNFSLYFKGIPAEIQMGTTGLKLQLAKLCRLIEHLRDTGRIKEASRIDLQYAGGAVVSFQPVRGSG